MVTLERDVKPRNINLQRLEGGGGFNREGVFGQINTLYIHF